MDKELIENIRQVAYAIAALCEREESSKDSPAIEARLDDAYARGFKEGWEQSYQLKSEDRIPRMG